MDNFKNNRDFLEQADSYLRNEMDPQERLAFERFCDENPEVAQTYKDHSLLVQKLREYQMRKQLKDNLAVLMQEKEEKPVHLQTATKIRLLWQKYKHTGLVAASVALVAVFSTLWMSGFYSVKESSNQYSLLKRDLNTIKRNVNAQNVAIKNISSDRVANKSTNEGAFGATGFALTSDGLIATNYHVVKTFDSVYVQNSAGESFKSKVVYIDPTHDIAVLKVVDDAFSNLPAIPYTFKEEIAELGQEVFTIGYPREDVVYGSGYLSARTGFAGDTASYQVTIPVNPGNSGGPLLDNKGNIIGIISGKQTETDGAAFAIKTNYLLSSVESIPADSLTQGITLNKRNQLAGLSRTNQIKKIQDYIFIVKVF